jgi:hypothetical protein
MYIVARKMGDELQFLKLFETEIEANQWAEHNCEHIETEVRFVQVDISEPWEHIDD